MKLQCVVDEGALLGEGLCWDAAGAHLWWVDIHGHKLHRFDPVTGADQVTPMPGPISAVAVRKAGGLVVAMGDGFARVDPSRRSVEWIALPEADRRGTRMNDGRTDRQGRFWAGSICEEPGKPARPVGSLYRLDADGSCTRMVGDIGISNGLAWSPDGTTMYHSDSITPFVWRWDYDVVTGDIANRQIHIDLSDIGAVADGATVDREGCYWVAIPFKGLVRRYDPDGRLMRSIPLPVDAPTCCEFGGPDLDILYVTSATFDRSADELATQPLAGGLFALDVGVHGIPPTPYAG